MLGGKWVLGFEAQTNAYPIHRLLKKGLPCSLSPPPPPPPLGSVIWVNKVGHDLRAFH